MFKERETLTRSGTNGAINAPRRETVDAHPTPVFIITKSRIIFYSFEISLVEYIPMLRMIVGSISAVYTYDVAKADVIPSLPSKNSETTAQVKSKKREAQCFRGQNYN